MSVSLLRTLPTPSDRRESGLRTPVPEQRSPSPDERPASGPRTTDRALVDPLMLLAPTGSRVVRGGRAHRLRALPSGTPVVLVVRGPFARSRALRLARRSGIVLERSLIAVPNPGSPVALVDDTESAVRYFWDHLVTVPPGLSRGYLLANLVLSVVRTLPWRWTGAMAWNHLAVGARR